MVLEISAIAWGSERELRHRWICKICVCYDQFGTANEFSHKPVTSRSLQRGRLWPAIGAFIPPQCGSATNVYAVMVRESRHYTASDSALAGLAGLID